MIISYKYPCHASDPAYEVTTSPPPKSCKQEIENIFANMENLAKPRARKPGSGLPFGFELIIMQGLWAEGLFGKILQHPVLTEASSRSSVHPEYGKLYVQICVGR